MAGRAGVGTLREAPLHADLKRWYAGEGDRLEEPVDGFVIDIVSQDVLVEIQTRGFSAIRSKLETLLEKHTVLLVHPIPACKWIVRRDETGKEISRRRSPKRGVAIDVFAELVSFPELLAHPGLTLEVLLTHEEEVRSFDGRRGWRRKGWVVDERRLLGVVERVLLESPGDLASFLPPELPTEFTTADLTREIGCKKRLAQQMAYCLRRLAVIERVGKDGNALVYRRRDF